MNILALDTCFDACSVSAGRGLRTLTPSIAFAYESMATGQAERLMPMIEMVMAEAGMRFDELTRIVVANGPGTFTGARIAVSAARALSLATGAEIVAVSSFQLMAMNYAVSVGAADILAIATDARRGEVYFQQFEARTLKPLGPPAVYAIERAAEDVGSGLSVIAGSGASAVAEAALALGRNCKSILPALLPDAFDMLFVASEMPVVATVAPLYLRPPDAKPPAPSHFAGNAA
jgi:tRNA threonylcarbamoyladenosine biosynthesis protein TsaB